jgi:uncharacterized protein YggE
VGFRAISRKDWRNPAIGVTLVTDLLAGRTRTRTLRASAAAIAILAVAAPGAPAQTERTVSVSGDATAIAPNDTAELSFRVTTRARRAGVALGNNSARMRRVIAAIKAQGIPAANIQTQHVALSRVRIKVRKGVHRRVYRATNGVRVTVRPIAKTGAVIQATVNAGATSFSGADVSSSHAEELYREALGRAFDEAHAKAEELAERAGATLGPALSISEGSVGIDSCCAQNASGQSGARRPPPIEPGTTTVSAEVTVTFALE